MEIVKKEIKIGDQPTFDAIKEIEAAKNHEINYEDAPKLSKKELSEFVPANPAYYKPKKQQITLKLDADVIEAFKRLGKGYQTKINAALRKAIFNWKLTEFRKCDIILKIISAQNWGVYVYSSWICQRKSCFCTR